MALVRIAHVIETLGTGGAENLLADVTARLDTSRFQSRVFTLDAPLHLRPRFERGGIPVEAILVPPRRRPVSCLLALTRALRRFRPDAVHTHLYYSNVFGRLAARAAGNPPVVTTLHNPDYTFEARDTQLFRFRKWLDRVTGRHNAALIAVSRAVAEDFQRHMGWRSIEVIPNGVDVDLFSPGPGTLTGDWPGPGLRLLSVGRLHPQKGHAVLLDALAQLRAQGPEASLLIVGEGSIQGQLKERIRRLGLSAVVRLGGRREDIRDLLRSADLFVFPSLYEAVGIALLEAMACGRPVVASDTGGIPEIVEHGTSGMLVPPGDSARLADSLGMLLKDPGRRQRLGDTARARALQFDVRRTAQATEALYERLGCSSHHPSRDQVK